MEKRQRKGTRPLRNSLKTVRPTAEGGPPERAECGLSWGQASERPQPFLSGSAQRERWRWREREREREEQRKKKIFLFSFSYQLRFTPWPCHNSLQHTRAHTCTHMHTHTHSVQHAVAPSSFAPSFSPTVFRFAFRISHLASRLLPLSVSALITTARVRTHSSDSHR